ncbi:hypothetical protein [Variovorax sp. Sphag1AA]|uniref:hypothetical protein n=1 Tax=Variovorax sp. Sphag1AA TaxID=2587027 RepID=UPI001C861650|nr:hypothetical protein [Variovorax sp. Sphag1AA]
MILISLALAGCAGMTSPQPKFAFHSFSFDGWDDTDKWAATVDLLEYSYGDQYRMVRKKVAPPRERLGPQAGVAGTMPVGDFLYVRWRIKATGEVVEDRVDLRALLPKDMTKHDLTFVIEGRQLYVYLVTPKPKGVKDPPILKTYLSWFNVTYEIYPTNTYAKK